MNLISFAQNLEDVVLWRGLGHLGPGFYVDIGAAWPERHSVTKMFYDAGWHGLNVEPSPDLFEELVKHRDRDINIRALVGSKTQNEVLFHHIPATGLSTGSAGLAQFHMEGGRVVERCFVPMLTLKEIFLRHCQDDQEIHFMKVDVEGGEEDVLLGNDWSRWRPWVVLIETVDVIDKGRRKDDVDVFMRQNGYTKTLFDGINTFYVESRLVWLQERLSVPANVLDGYVTSELFQLRELLHDADRWGRELQLQILLQKLENPQGVKPPPCQELCCGRAPIVSETPTLAVASAPSSSERKVTRRLDGVARALGKRIMGERLLRWIVQFGRYVLRRYPSLGHRLIAIVYSLLRRFGLSDREIAGLFRRLRDRVLGASGDQKDSGTVATESQWVRQPKAPELRWSTQVVKHPWLNALMRQGGE